ncbi:hypothetical protein AMECASPLE_006666 [Ameca splendens]|uniref:Secreted protein n=1 Tax=Ameca splendens TaxID=208324 RepID=A0ABV0XZS3_9TELE
MLLWVLCDLLDESFICSCSNFGRAATSGKVHHCSTFSSFDNGSHCGSPRSQNLRNGFVTLSRLRNFNDFVSHLFLNFFRSGRDVLLCEIFQSTLCCQKVSYYNFFLDSTGLGVNRPDCG